MTQRIPRVALTNQEVTEKIRQLNRNAEWVTSDPRSLSSLIGKVDFFLLDDDTAIRFLGSVPEDTWPSVVVFAKDGESLPAVYQQGLAEDLLILPPRALDLERVLRHHEYVRMLRDLEESSHGVASLVKQLQDDIHTAQKIQRRLIREKFPAMGPLTVKSKYWCGLKSGGDYFDIFEFPGGSHAGLILGDSSSYALSTSLIGSLTHFSVHVGAQELHAPEKLVQTLFGKVREAMKEKDKLSLLYGVLDRKTYALRFVSCGAVFLAKLGREGRIEWGARGEHFPLSLQHPAVPEAREILLEPGDRLLVCSDGWGEALEEAVPSMMESVLHQHKDAQDLMNEMAFRLRQKLEGEKEIDEEPSDDFPMPPQDCSTLLLDLAPNVLRLAR